MPSQNHAHPESAAPAWEIWAVRVLLALYVVVQVNNIHNQAFHGQDFDYHVSFTHELAERKDGTWFKMDSTSRPLLYWLGGWCERYTYTAYGFQMAAMIGMLLVVPAVLVVHRVLRGLVARPELRLAVLAVMTLLPVNVIAGVVFSGDLFALLPFVTVAWALGRSLEAAGERAGLGWAALAGGVLAAANFGKATFLVQPFAVVVAVGLAWRWGRIAARRTLLTLGLAALVPLAVGAAIHAKNQRELRNTEPRHEFDFAGTGQMTWRSLLGLKASDARIFDAPGYFDTATVDGNTTQPLLIPNSYSYPALLHLGAFTDVLDYANQGGYDPGVLRPEPQKQFSKLAVRSGVLWSLLAVAGVAAMGGRLLWSLGRPRVAPPSAVAVWAVMGAVWFLPLVLTLPFLFNAYWWGYWLPRLVVPALWSAALIAGWSVDRILTGRSVWWARAVLGLAAVQAYWQVRSLWY
jgi:hypothetical protein